MNSMKSVAVLKKEDILSVLFENKDEKYREFTSSLNPSVSINDFIGVRVPIIRALSKSIKGTEIASEFLKSLPHRYLEENHLHGFLIEHERDFSTALSEIIRFLPYIDNWATCDCIRPKVFKKHPSELLPYIKQWLQSNHTYTVRYAIGLLLSFYLDDEFDKEHLSMVSQVSSDEYYVNMMIAWYFATALVKQYEHAIPYIENAVLQKWTHNKTIQKACESYRVSDTHKAYLRTLKIK